MIPCSKSKNSRNKSKIMNIFSAILYKARIYCRIIRDHERFLAKQELHKNNCCLIVCPDSGKFKCSGRLAAWSHFITEIVRCTNKFLLPNFQLHFRLQTFGWCSGELASIICRKYLKNDISNNRVKEGIWIPTVLFAKMNSSMKMFLSVEYFSFKQTF